MKKMLIIFAIMLLITAFCLMGAFFGLFEHWLGNKIDFANHKIDDATKYETLKQVEDTCRAMISSYTTDKLIYDQYKDSTNEEKKSWAEQAKMRANKTAAEYNNYVLKNSFVWNGNVPSDICEEIPYIE